MLALPFIASTASATEAEQKVMEISVAEAPRHGQPGSSLVLATEQVPGDVRAMSCFGKFVGSNNASVWLGNDLVVASGGNEITLQDVEREPGVTTTAQGNITLGDDVTVTLVFGPDGTSSVSGMVKLVCELPVPEPPEVPVPVMPVVTASAICTEQGTVDVVASFKSMYNVPVMVSAHVHGTPMSPESVTVQPGQEVQFVLHTEFNDLLPGLVTFDEGFDNKGGSREVAFNAVDPCPTPQPEEPCPDDSLVLDPVTGKCVSNEPPVPPEPPVTPTPEPEIPLAPPVVTTVEVPTPTLPVTGSSTVPLAIAGFGMLTSGLLITWKSRRMQA